MGMRPADEMVTVDLPRGQFRVLVAATSEASKRSEAVGDVEAGIILGWIAAKVVRQIDPEYAESHPMPPDVEEKAEALIAADARLHRP